jgi:hypothetical protein
MPVARRIGLKFDPRGAVCENAILTGHDPSLEICLVEYAK